MCTRAGPLLAPLIAAIGAVRAAPLPPPCRPSCRGWTSCCLSTGRCRRRWSAGAAERRRWAWRRLRPAAPRSAERARGCRSGTLRATVAAGLGCAVPVSSFPLAHAGLFSLFAPMQDQPLAARPAKGHRALIWPVCVGISPPPAPAPVTHTAPAGASSPYIVGAKREAGQPHRRGVEQLGLHGGGAAALRAGVYTDDSMHRQGASPGVLWR